MVIYTFQLTNGCIFTMCWYLKKEWRVSSSFRKRALWGWDTPLWSSSLSTVRVDVMVVGVGEGVLDWWGWARQRVRPKPFTLSLCLDSISTKQFHPLSTNKSYFQNNLLPYCLFLKAYSHRWIKSKFVQLIFQIVLYCAVKYS